jgi:hypothetical protein
MLQGRTAALRANGHLSVTIGTSSWSGNFQPNGNMRGRFLGVPSTPGARRGNSGVGAVTDRRCPEQRLEFHDRGQYPASAPVAERPRSVVFHLSAFAIPSRTCIPAPPSASLCRSTIRIALPAQQALALIPAVHRATKRVLEQQLSGPPELKQVHNR